MPVDPSLVTCMQPVLQPMNGVCFTSSLISSFCQHFRQFIVFLPAALREAQRAGI